MSTSPFKDDASSRPRGCLCSYQGYLTGFALTSTSLTQIREDARKRGFPNLDLGDNYLEFAFEGRDSNQHVVDFLRMLAPTIGSASGEIRCEV